MTFRQFIEADMAPPGQPPDPDNQDRSHDDLNVLGRELDISPEELQQALQGTPILSFSPIRQRGQPIDSGPEVIIPDKVNASGSVDGRVMTGNRQKRRNPNGFRDPTSPSTRPIHFRGIDRDDTTLSFPNIWLEPFRKQQQQMGGGMGMMGGGPGPGAIPPPPGM